MGYAQWFSDPEQYRLALERFAIPEAEYCAALLEVTTLFPPEISRRRKDEAAKRLGSLSHFDLLPYPNQHLPYNPVPILLACGVGLPQLLYLGLAIRDFKRVIGPTKALKRLTTEREYRGALFEIEVGAVLARSGLKPCYGKTSPDFVLPDLPLGLEVSTREVPIPRAVAERLIGTLSTLEFGRLTVELTIPGEQDLDSLMTGITEDIRRLLSTRETKLTTSRCTLGHDATRREERTVEITIGENCYENTLRRLIGNRLAEKEEQIRSGLNGRAPMKCVVALDVRSLLLARFEAKSEHEQRLVERNAPHFDRQRILHHQVVMECQTFVAASPLVKGVLVWNRRRLSDPPEADAVHQRYSISLLTAEDSLEVDGSNLAGELVRIARIS